MKIIFIDETKNIGGEKFMGVCIAVVDSSKYPALIEEYLELFMALGWNKKQEFKGRFLFSEKGDRSISIDKRIEFVKKLISLNVGKKNARWQVTFCCNKDGQDDKNRIILTRRALQGVLPSRGKQKAKDPVVVFFDEDKSMKDLEWNDAIFPILNERGYCPVEGISKLSFDYRHVGIVLVDVLAYLAGWHCVAADFEKAAAGVLSETKTNERRVKVVRELLAQLKNKRLNMG